MDIKVDMRLLTKHDVDKCAKLIIEAYNRPQWDYNRTFEMAVQYLPINSIII